MSRLVYWSLTFGIMIAVVVGFVLVMENEVLRTEIFAYVQAAMDKAEAAEAARPADDSFSWAYYAQMVLSWLALLLLVSSNLVAIRQARRAGQAWWYSFVPFNRYFRYFDRQAWLDFLALILSGVLVVLLANFFLPAG